MKCYHTFASGSHQVNGKICQDIINCHSKPGSVESAESSEEGKLLFLSLLINYSSVLKMKYSRGKRSKSRIVLFQAMCVIIWFNGNRFIKTDGESP